MFGQYSAEDISLSPGGDVWAGSIYQSPSVVTGTNPQATGITNQLLPALTNIVKAAAPAVSSYFQYSAQKSASGTGLQTNPNKLQTPTYQRPLTASMIGGVPITTWLMVGGGTLAAMLLLRKKGGGMKGRRRRR